MLRILPALASSLLLLVSFPIYHLGWFAWFACVPLLCAIAGRGALRGFCLSFLSGVFFFAFLFDRLFEVPAFTVVHQILLSSCFALLFALFGLLFGFLSTRLGITAGFVTAPFVWISLEYAKSNIPHFASPYPLLGYSQHSFLPAIQIASITGSYGVSFLVMTVNCSLALAVMLLLSRRKKGDAGLPAFQEGGRWAIAAIAAALLITASSFVYGAISLARPVTGRPVRVALVQGNVPQSKKWDPEHAETIMQLYEKLSEEAARQEPDLIIWPEAATPLAITKSMKTYRAVRHIAARTGSDLLLGSSSHNKFRGQEQPEKLQPMNSAFLIPRDGASKPQRYDKIILFPFGEYLPMRETIPWSRINVPDMEGHVPGEEYAIFETPSFHFAATICWENGFPALVRKLVSGGAQFVVNIANDAWFGRGAASHQFVSYNVFRAVEHRTFVVRCANTGVSCIIDPKGRIVGKVRDADGAELFVRGILIGTVVPLESGTYYTRHGDWIVWLAFMLSAFMLVAAVFRRDRGGTSVAAHRD